jgi:GT2 family glycosyltransferase
MISIITAVHNGLPMNRLFWHYLSKYTFYPFELIIIDNNSTDGSREFFKSVGAKVIENELNYTYPVCQNQGIAVAKYDIFAFMNNDIIVSPHWDKRLLEVADAGGFDIITPVGIEMLEDEAVTKAIKRKWLRIKNPLALFGFSDFNLKLMHRLMYGYWERFANKGFEKFGLAVKEGFIGNTVMMRRAALAKIGLWDERIQGADFDLYIRSKKRSMEQKDIKPVQMALGVFIHHYIRLTSKSTRAPFADKANIISNEEKWGIEKMRFYCRDITTNL